MTGPDRLSKPLYAAAGLLERVLCRLAAGVLPWSTRSQHSAYLTGYIDGLKDGGRRRDHTDF